MLFKRSLLAAILMCNGICMYAQERTGKPVDVSVYRNQNKKFFDEKTGVQFTPMEEWTCVDGQPFDLYKTGRPAVIYFGFATCAGCRKEMPLFLSLCNDNRYKVYDFVYVTFDDTAEINKEMNTMAVAVNNRVKIVTLPKEYLSRNYVHGYPTIYFLDKEKTVKLIHAFGGYEGPLDTKEDWAPLLAMIK